MEAVGAESEAEAKAGVDGAGKENARPTASESADEVEAVGVAEDGETGAVVAVAAVEAEVAAFEPSAAAGVAAAVGEVVAAAHRTVGSGVEASGGEAAVVEEAAGVVAG